MKKQHFLIGITLICVLFVVVNFYSRKMHSSKIFSEDIASESDRTREEIKPGGNLEKHYIPEGNPFDMQSQEYDNDNFKFSKSSQPTKTLTTTTATSTTTKLITSTTAITKQLNNVKEILPLKSKKENLKKKPNVSKSNNTLLEIKMNHLKNNNTATVTARVNKSNRSSSAVKGNLSKQLSSNIAKVINTTLLTPKVNTVSGVRIYSWNGSWSLSSMCEGLQVKDFQEATLNTMSGQTPIFVYSETQDKYVSHDIIRTGWWEHHLAVPMVTMMQQDPSLTFLDIGANIGAFTLEIAKMGRKTISVEPLRDNIQRLCCSVHKGKLESMITIVANAISNKHLQVTLGKDLDNVGGTFVNKDNPAKVAQIVMNGEYSTPVNTILLDDLLGLPEKPKRVLIKMDVEGYEQYVLEGGTYFFKQVFVKAVFMEWTYSNNPSIRDSIIKFMVNRDFLPYSLSMHESILESPYDAWPGNIVWINQIKK
ncbi:uncharacterized protein LOC133205875 [Saccostrea echinata]|uniref:uncharacterized protein LOC133205875 n=1 Tax=Saccostrea echinata TaxID=191078 RepID=UPI002A830156|nr:uncharacterized protein LOC133205875 [Saccostrea echinata]